MNVAFIFPGQGSQSIGMGKDFFENSEIAKDLIKSSSDRLKVDFTKLLFEENDLINQTEYTQPAILLVSAIAFKLFKKSININAKYTLGHSLGEFTSLVSANALDTLDAIELTHRRGLFMKDACSDIDAGMMALVGISDDSAEKICVEERKNGKKIWCANYNIDGQIVLAGIKSDLESLTDKFKENGAKKAILLNMSVSSHCELLESAREKLDDYLNSFLKDNFLTPVISNVTAKKYDSKAKAIELLSKQLVSPVLYKQSIQSIESEVDMFIEFGNGKVLKGLNRKITKKPTLNVSDIASLEKTLEQLQ